MIDHFDVAIIGAGSSGCILAHYLSEDPACRVILLEAGDFPSDPDIRDPKKWPQLAGRDYDWAYKTVPQFHTANRQHEWPRGRVVGGSSCLHAMAYVRGHRADFDQWGEAGGAAWTYEGLLPAFEALEKPTGKNKTFEGAHSGGLLDVYMPSEEFSPLASSFVDAGRALGVPPLANHNQGELIGVAPNSLNISLGQRVSAADAYLGAEIIARENLTIASGHLAERLLIENRQVVGLQVKTDGGVGTIRADRFVLAAGAIASPLLLMRSGVGDPSALKQAQVDCIVPLVEVGQNLQDHMLVLGNLYGAAQEIAPSRLQHSESLMYLNSADLSAQSGVPDIVIACVVAPLMAPGIQGPGKGLPPQGAAFTLLSGITHPASRGHLVLGGPASEDKPLINPNYLESASDRRLMRKALRTARLIGEQAPLAPWKQKELLPGIEVQSDSELDDFIARAASTHHHPAGTCRMARDNGAVVDENLKVTGLENAYVVDASIMPSLPSGPINGATMAIARNWISLQV